MGRLCMYGSQHKTIGMALLAGLSQIALSAMCERRAVIAELGDVRVDLVVSIARMERA